MTELARIETQQPMKIADLTIDSEINVSRLGQLDLVVVAEYAAAMQDNIIFPDVVAFDDGENKWLSDGFHRVEAAKTSRLDEIGVDLRSGSRDDAIEYACQANAGHGLQRTNEGKRVVVELMLKRRNEWSDRQIARWCKVSQPFVGKIRGEFHTDNVTSMKQRTFVHHKTGKPATMNTANIGKPKAEVELPSFSSFSPTSEDLSNANYHEGEDAHCKYCHTDHKHWHLGMDYECLVWICGLCDHATADEYMFLYPSETQDIDTTFSVHWKSRDCS